MGEVGSASTADVEPFKASCLQLADGDWVKAGADFFDHDRDADCLADLFQPLQPAEVPVAFGHGNFLGDVQVDLQGVRLQLLDDLLNACGWGQGVDIGEKQTIGIGFPGHVEGFKLAGFFGQDAGGA